MFVRSYEKRAIGQRRFRQNEGIVDLPFRDQFCTVQFPRDRLDDSVTYGDEIQRPELPYSDEFFQD